MGGLSVPAATGLRISEALTLARGDVDLEAGVLRVTGKYGKVRLVPLHPTMTSTLARYTTRLSDFPRSFISGVRPRPSLSGPPGDQPDGRARDLPVLAHGGSVHAQGL